VEGAQAWSSPAGDLQGLSCGEALLKLAEGVELWHTFARDAYGTVVAGGEAASVTSGEPGAAVAAPATPPATTGKARILSVGARGGEFRPWLVARYWAARGKAPTSTALGEAMEVCRARALEGPLRAVNLRVAEHEGALYVDLAGPDLRAIEIDGEGYRVVDRPPVQFWRSSGLAPLPEPRGGVAELSRLRGLLNVGTAEDMLLAVAWLLGTLQVGVPYPVLLLLGEAGSGKSTAMRLLRMLTDPAGAHGRAVSGPPREGKDLFAVVRARHVLAIDNLSAVPQWLSDSLSTVATGGGQDTRALYTDADLASVDAQNPIVLNGVAVQGLGEDLLDRAIVLTLERPTERRREREFWAEVEEAWPWVLGGLCDAASCALRNAGTGEIAAKDLPRMADFATWVVGAADALGTVPGLEGLNFLEAYRANRQRAGEDVIASNPIGTALLELLEAQGRWRGPAGQLLEALGEYVDEHVRGLRSWPRTAQSVGVRLQRLAPALREAGWSVGHGDGRARRDWIIMPREEATIQGEIPF